MPSGFVTPRKDEASWSGSGNVSAPPAESRRSASWKAVVTEALRVTRASKPEPLGTTAIAPIGLRSATTVAPAEVTTWRIWAGVVPGMNRTTVTPKGLPAAEADPVIASAAANVARRRLGRFTVFHLSAEAPCGLIVRSGNDEGPARTGP